MAPVTPPRSVSPSEDDDSSAALHNAMVVLRKELEQKNARIQELERKKGDFSPSDLRPSSRRGVTINHQRRWSSASSQTDISATTTLSDDKEDLEDQNWSSDSGPNTPWAFRIPKLQEVLREDEQYQKKGRYSILTRDFDPRTDPKQDQYLYSNQMSTNSDVTSTNRNSQTSPTSSNDQGKCNKALKKIPQISF